MRKRDLERDMKRAIKRLGGTPEAIAFVRQQAAVYQLNLLFAKKCQRARDARIRKGGV